MGIWRFAGAFAVVERQGELKISEANAGVKPANCTSASLWTRAHVRGCLLGQLLGFQFITCTSSALFRFRKNSLLN
ncbi:MAG: hypothetical protein H6Q14_2714 [Bacteroidetes bacterium]|nr:hypothetical protein [Bacteroidota bacterium]